MGTLKATTLQHESASSGITMDASGKVGIGTSSPTDGKLHVVSDGNAAEVIGSFEANNGTQSLDLGYYYIKQRGGSYLTFDVGSSERMRIQDNGNVLLGTTSTGFSDEGHVFRAGDYASHTVDGDTVMVLNRTTSDGGSLQFRKDGTYVGGVSVTSSSTSYNTSSDYRLKENATAITDGITRVKQLKPKRFNFIAEPDTTVDGFMAHEAQAVVPEAVTGTQGAVNDDGTPDYQGIDQSKLVPILTAALQEAVTKIETLETELTSVKSRLDVLESEA